MVLIGCATENKNLSKYFAEIEYAQARARTLRPEIPEPKAPPTYEYEIVMFYMAYGVKMFNETLAGYAEQGWRVKIVIPGVMQAAQDQDTSFITGIFILFERETKIKIKESP